MPRVPKTGVTVAVPPVLGDFLWHVARLIAEGDEATLIESDDLLQCDGIFGGLMEPGTKRFGFCYFPADEATRDDEKSAAWHIELNASQIQAVADGSLRQLELWQCAGGSCGCLNPTEDSYCTHCDSIRHFDEGCDPVLVAI